MMPSALIARSSRLPSPCPDESALASFVDGTLDPRRALALEEHVDACTACYGVLATYARAYLTSGAVGHTVTRSTPENDAELVLRLQQSRALAPGSALGRYMIIDWVGEGAAGVVYAAYDPELDRRVALKVLSPKRQMRGDLAVQERLLREARAMAKLAHPNVVAVHDVGSVGEHVFLAMEFVDGSTLRAWLAEHPRSAKEILGAFREAGQGLVAAHAAGLVHRDFKPDNVLVGRDGRVRVTDFGLACVPRSESEPGEEGERRPREGSGSFAFSSWTGAIAGTPAYMAPEQRLGRPADARSDQYSFCVSLHEALLGHRPDSAAPASAPSRALSKRLRSAIVRGLAERPRERFTSMQDLLVALDADHGRPRRGLAVLATTALVVGLGGWAVTHAALGRARMCSQAAAGLHGVWDDDRKRAISAAFLATNLPYAADAWRGVEETGDAYAAKWKAARTDSCEATRLRGEQSDTLFTLRTECLDRRLGELTALSDLLASADAPVVEHAALAVSRLRPLASCSDPAVLALRVRPPEDPEAQKRVAALHQELDRVRALEAAGKAAAVLPDAQNDATHAKAIGYRPVEAEALYLVGTLETDTAAFQSAVPTLYEAVTAAEAGRDDELAAEIWATLVELLGGTLDRFPEAEQCEQRALAAIERTGSKGRGLLVLEEAEATMDRERGRYESAVAKGREALALEEKTFGPRSLPVSKSLKNLASALRDNGDYDESLRDFTRSLEIQEELLGKDHPEVASTLQSLAIFHNRLGQYGEATTRFERALAIRERTLGPMHPQVGETLGSLVVALRWSGEARRALPLAERALQIEEAAFGGEHDLTAGAMNNVGFVRVALKDYVGARSILERALAVREKALGPHSSKVAISLTNLGQVALAEGKGKEALELYGRASAIDDAALKPDHPDRAYSLLGLGRSRLLLGEAGLALPLLERADALRESHPVPPRMLAEARFALARALLESHGDRARAVALAEQARTAYAAAGRGFEDDLAGVQAWLAARAVD